MYNQFSKVYNKFMDDTPYDKWVEFINSKINEHNIKPNIICDLGCGTGVMCGKFALQNIEVIGIDNSEEMLMEARACGQDILYLAQDMREFELYGTVDVIYSCCDSLNYLLEEEDIIKTFKLVNNYLESGGLFIFDINTPYKYKEVLADETFAEQSDCEAYIWENFYDEHEGLNEFAVNFFIKDLDGKYTRTEEFHYQRAYNIEQIQKYLQLAGLELLGIYDDYSNKPYSQQTLRATFVAREGHNKNKLYI
ncbi:MAG: methyltransferase [Epulopiscium sp. Nele67-Bin002]|nr:MAG: methyltransferase [Epulopiscium sp. Nuni2H_MBin001]OON91635.1 MAG: methyltransferase [Epulopiscium sp. Nele67-Bin002]